MVHSNLLSCSYSFPVGVTYSVDYCWRKLECNRYLVDKASRFHDVRACVLWCYYYFWTSCCYFFFQIVPSYICWFYYSCRVDSWRSPSVVYFLVLQLLAGLVASVELNWNGFQWQDSFWNGFLCTVEHIGEIILAWSLWSYTLCFLL